MNITLEELLAFCEEKRICNSYCDWQNNEYFAIRVTWHTGGYYGGNCWDDTEPEYRDSYDDQLSLFDDPDFVTIIKNFCPQIDIIKCKELSNIINEDNYTEYEYYGNTSDYSFQEVKLTDLVDFINKNEL